MKVKDMNEEDYNNQSLNASGKRSIKNTTIYGNTKKLTEVSKKIENVEYLMKIENKNKKQLEEKYSKTIKKIENQLEKLEKDLETTFRELNEKESKIFELQKNKLEVFKGEINKYENVYWEIEEKYKSIEVQLEDSKPNERILYNNSSMIYEDYLSHNQEILTLKKKIIEYKDNLTEIEKTYPKEFNFLLDDIQLEKELNEILVHKKHLQLDIDHLENNKKELTKSKSNKQADIKTLNCEVKKHEEAIETNKNDTHLVKMEEHIIKNVNDILLFEKLKILMQNYYNQKNFDLENELNVVLIKNLNEKLKEMKNEFNNIKNEKILNKAKLEKMLEELTKIYVNNKNALDRSRVEKDIQLRQSELERVNNEINILELNCKKKETLFNKYIIVLRNKCKKSAQESYYEMNPSLVIETDFEEKFKEEILKNIDNDLRFTEEEKIKNKNMFEIYFKELLIREKTLQGIVMKKKKTEENLENLIKDIEKIDENFSQFEVQIINKKSVINELIMKEKLFYEKIDARNRNLTKNLEQLGEAEFVNYMKSNDQILKNMKKVYGNKVLDKVFKVQKQKFLENVIMDHSFKKGKVNEYIQSITKFKITSEYRNSSMTELEGSYNLMMGQYEGLINFQNSKNKEKEVLEEGKADLKEKIELILSTQVKEIENDKKQLQFKFNVNYYIEKIKDLSKRAGELNIEKENHLKEYEDFLKIINEKEQKLYHNDLDLKNNLISLSIGGKEENVPKTVMPYKVNNNKSYDYNSSSDDIKEEENFANTMRKSVLEFNSRGESLKKDDILEEVMKRDDTVQSPLKEIQASLSKDPLFDLMIEKIKPLVTGLNIYKKFNNNSLTGKIFDPLQGNQNPPESCGFTMRLFKICPSLSILEIKNTKSKHIEQKINLNQLKGIMLSSVSKNLIKQRKSVAVKPNGEVNQLFCNDYIPFNLLHSDGTLDLIAPNFSVYKALEGAVEELIKNQKNLKGIMKCYDE